MDSYGVVQILTHPMTPSQQMTQFSGIQNGPDHSHEKLRMKDCFYLGLSSKGIHFQ